MAHGRRPDKTESSRAFSKNLRDIRRVAYFLVLIITSNSVPGIVDGLEHPQLLGKDGAIALWNFYLETLPLTTSAAIIGMLSILLIRYREHRSAYIVAKMFEMNFGCLAFCLSFIFMLGAGVSLLVGYGGVTASNWNTIIRAVNDGSFDLILTIYFQKYGLKTFLLAWVVGVFIAWVLVIKLWQRPQKTKTRSEFNPSNARLPINSILQRSGMGGFTDRAIKALFLAEGEVGHLHNEYICPQHLLLGLVREGEGVAAKVLSSLGVEYGIVLSQFHLLGSWGNVIRPGVIGPMAREVIELAVDEARRLNHSYLSTGHLLLGLAREYNLAADWGLERQGVNLEEVRTRTIQMLASEKVGTQFQEIPNDTKTDWTTQRLSGPDLDGNMTASLISPLDHLDSSGFYC